MEALRSSEENAVTKTENVSKYLKYLYFKKNCTFIAILVFKLLSRKVLFINRKENRNC